MFYAPTFSSSIRLDLIALHMWNTHTHIDRAQLEFVHFMDVDVSEWIFNVEVLEYHTVQSYCVHSNLFVNRWPTTHNYFK